MAFAQTGIPSGADILLILDRLGTWFQREYSAHGLGLASEASAETIAYDAQAALSGIMGDGTTSNPGIANSKLKAMLDAPLRSIVRGSRYDVQTQTFMSGFGTGLIGAIEQLIANSLPAGMKFVVSGVNSHALDTWLIRLNANDPGVPATPSYTLSSTAATGGSAGPCGGSGDPTAPRVKITGVGTYDWQETQPTSGVSLATLTAPNCAWTLGGLTGNVPSGWKKINIYRQLLGASSGDAYYYDQSVSVNAGDPWSGYTITLKNDDFALRQDYSPPSWLQAMLLPEESFLFAVAFAALSQGNLNQNSPLSFQAMISPSNVAINPANGFLGLKNPSTTGVFRSWVSGSQVAGGITAANDTTQNIQGFGGAAGGLQARVTIALSGGSSCVLTGWTYTYLDASNPTTPQTATITGQSLALSDAVGQTADLSIPAGRLVLTVTSVTVTGRTTGTIIIEGKALRSI